MKFQTLALASGILFGLATPASKWLVADMGPYALAGFLYLGAAVAMLPRVRGAWLPTGKDRLRLLGSIALGGIAGPLLLLAGLMLARASSVSVWLNLELAWTAVLGVLAFQERSSRWMWLAVAFVLAGSLVLALRETQAGLLAGSLVAAACLAWAFDNHWTAQIRSITPAVMTFWKGAVGGSVNLAVGLIAGSNLAVVDVGFALIVGAVSYGVSIALYVTAARGIGATRAQALFAAAPLWGLLAAVGFLQEPWDARLGVALGCVFLAVLALWREASVAARHATRALA